MNRSISIDIQDNNLLIENELITIKLFNILTHTSIDFNKRIGKKVFAFQTSNYIWEIFDEEFIVGEIYKRSFNKTKYKCIAVNNAKTAILKSTRTDNIISSTEPMAFKIC